MRFSSSIFPERPIRLRRYIGILTCVWSVVIGLSLWFAMRHCRQEVLEEARQQAELIYDRSLGGFTSILDLSDLDRLTPENISHLIEIVQDVPVFAHDAAGSNTQSLARLVGLNPRNPRNRPDAWEAAALDRFNKGESEICSIVRAPADEAVFRLIRPMVITPRCLPCHASARVGQLWGGLSVMVPFNPLWAIEWPQFAMILGGHGLIWVIGLGGLWLIATGLRARIREREQNRRALQHERDFASAVIDTAGALVIVLDREGTIVRFNRTCEKATGFTAAEMLGKKLWEAGLLPPGIQEEIREVSTKIARGEAQPDIMNHENFWQTRQGGRRLISWSNTLLADEAGAVEFIIGTGIDITEHRMLESSIRSNEEKYRNLFESCSDALFIAEAETGILRDANAAAVKLMGMPREALIGLHQTKLHPRGEEEAYREQFARHRVHGAALVVSDIQRADGQCVPVEISASVFTSEGRQLVQGVFRDISERRRLQEEQQRLEEKLQQAQKLESLGVLAGGIAHDFNNLLMGVLGYADLALTELPPESPARASVQQIVTAALRAAELTRQMLAYSGKGRFVIESLDMTRLVEEMTHLLQVSISKKAVLRYDFAENLPAIEGDATQIRQVIMNLITNASDAIGERSGMITITTGVMEADREYLGSVYMDDDLPDGFYAYVEVTDSGCGMTRETLARIFDPFYTTKFTGRGLGLAAVLGIVRGHKGAIKVYSEPGRGSTFKVLFPCNLAQTATAAALPSDAALWQGHGTIMVVDDEDTVRAVGKMTLERGGYQVIVAGDGREAVELFREHGQAVDLVILDMTMPHMGGEETFRELRRLRAGIRVILSSGYNEQEATHRFAGKGLSGFIQKPYRGRDLLDKVSQLLGEEAGSGNGAGIAE